MPDYKLASNRTDHSPSYSCKTTTSSSSCPTWFWRWTCSWSRNLSSQCSHYISDDFHKRNNKGTIFSRNIINLDQIWCIHRCIAVAWCVATVSSSPCRCSRCSWCRGWRWTSCRSDLTINLDKSELIIWRTQSVLLLTFSTTENIDRKHNRFLIWMYLLVFLSIIANVCLLVEYHNQPSRWLVWNWCWKTSNSIKYTLQRKKEFLNHISDVNKLKSLKVAKWRKDEWWMLKAEWWRMMISSCWGVSVTNRQTNERTFVNVESLLRLKTRYLRVN